MSTAPPANAVPVPAPTHTIHATPLKAESIAHFQVGHVRKSPHAGTSSSGGAGGGAINSIDFSSRGDSMIFSTDEPDEALYLCATATAQVKKSLFCKKSGCDLVRFTHHPTTVIVASKNKGWDDTIRYLSLHDNKYLRYFKGHRNRVTSLSQSPIDDTFLSGSLDRTVRLWDLRTNVCAGVLQVPDLSTMRLPSDGKILAAHDPSGMVFAVACSPNLIKLYDSRSYEAGPFITFDELAIPPPAASVAPGPPINPAFFSWSSLKFSPDGKDLLLTTTQSHSWPGAAEAGLGSQQYINQILLVDSYEGTLKRRFTGHEYNPTEAPNFPVNGAAANNAGGAQAPASAQQNSPACSQWQWLPFEASFSPDGAFVFAGSRAGSVHAWNTTTGQPLAIWNGLNSTAPLTAVQFCPTKMCLVSGDANGQVLWWIPAPPASHAPQPAFSQM